MESDDNAFDTPITFESPDLSERDWIRELDFETDFDRGGMGGYASKGAEKDMRLIDWSPSDSLPSSGMGTVCARSRDSGPLVARGNSPELCVGTRAGAREPLLRLQGGGEIWPVEDGGEAGRAVSIALRMVEALAGLAVAANGDEVRRREAGSSEGEGGEAALSDPPEGARTWEMVTGWTMLALTERGIPPDMARARGGGKGGEDGDDESLRGEDGLFIELLGEVTGEPARFDGNICDADVAWWRSEGGAVAMAFALARLAAIAAATLFFLLFLGVVGGKLANPSGLGHTFSTCFRAIESKVSRIAKPLSGQTSSKTQNNNRADSRTGGLVSLKAFFKDFSNVSRPPEDSMAFFERWP